MPASAQALGFTTRSRSMLDEEMTSAASSTRSSGRVDSRSGTALASRRIMKSGQITSPVGGSSISPALSPNQSLASQASKKLSNSHRHTRSCQNTGTGLTMSAPSMISARW